MWDLGGHWNTPHAPLPPPTPAVAVADHAKHTDLLAQLHGQDHGEPARAQEGARFQPVKHRGHTGVGGTVLLAHPHYGCLMGGQMVHQGDLMGLLRNQQYLFFPVSFWKTSSQYVIFSSVRV